MHALRLEVPHQLFTPAMHERFEGEYCLGNISAGVDTYLISEPMSWMVDLTNTGNAILVTGNVIGEATTSCARCLEDVHVSITGEIEAYFLIDEEVEGIDEEDEGEFEVLAEDRTIDLASLIKAAVILEFPLVPLCSTDCKGLCACCGTNLNEDSCGCARAEDHGRSAHPFAALADYSFE